MNILQKLKNVMITMFYTRCYHHVKIMKPQHEVIVYDENGGELERTMESINVTHMVRFKHVIGDYTTYSFNTHYDNGMIHYGMVPSSPFSGAYLKHETE